MKKKYDIFISYRRTDSDGKNIGTQLARTLQKEFERRGYKVFFDYSDCKDEDFVKTIFPAIASSKIFVLLLTNYTLDRCVNSKDWIRQEIFQAIKCGCKIIPLNPDSSFKDWPKDFPTDLEPIKTIQISDINTGSLFEKSIDYIEEVRIRPYIKPIKRIGLLIKISIAIIISFVFVLGIDAYRYSQCNTISDYTEYCDNFGLFKKKAQKQTNLIINILNSSAPERMQQMCNFDYSNITFEQATAIKQILENMVFVEGGSFYMGRDSNTSYYESKKESPRHLDSVCDYWISQFEFSIREKDMLFGNKNKDNQDVPLVNITWFGADSIAKILRDLTGLEFDLPTEQQWEYAASAKGLEYTHFSGSDDAIQVAWCKVHPSIGDSAHCRNDNNAPMNCNKIDLYDMSGNVWEWCKNDFFFYQNNRSLNTKVIRGGSFRSELYQLSITYRDTQSPSEKSNDVGFRLVINIPK